MNNSVPPYFLGGTEMNGGAIKAIRMGTCDSQSLKSGYEREKAG
jgi:hypothetical protein